MTTNRYQIKRVKFSPYLPDDPEDDGKFPYGLWDKQERVYVNKFGQPDGAYWCSTRAVAEMRRRDLNEYSRA